MISPKLYFPFSDWSLSGVCTFSYNLGLAFLQSGVEIHLIRSGCTSCDLPDGVPLKRFSSINEYSSYLKASDPAVVISAFLWRINFIERIPKHHYIYVVQSHDPYFYIPLLLNRNRWHAVVGVSSRITRSLDQLGITAELIPNGVSMPAPRRRPQSCNDRIRLLYAGRLAEVQKRVSRLITVADRLRQAGVPFEIRIVGSGHMECRLRQYFSAEEMPGRVEPYEVGRYYEWADFFLLPSDFEGESLALLEAMAYGCVPVLGPFDSDVALKVSTEGLGYRGTVEGMIAYIKSFEGQAERLHALGVLNQQFLSNSEYRLDRVAAGYSDLFQRVVLQPPLELGEAKISRLLLKVYNTLLFSRFRGPVTRASLSAMRLK